MAKTYEIIKKKRTKSGNHETQNNREYIDYDTTYEGSIILQQIIRIINVLVVGVLGLRFIFALFGANPANSIVNTVYTITEPLVSPFRGIFGTTSELSAGVPVFEPGTLLAMIAIGLLFMIINAFIGLFNKRKVL
jgi:uncharacterized protein YggT (Ycf19 family)